MVFLLTERPHATQDCKEGQGRGGTFGEASTNTHTLKAEGLLVQRWRENRTEPGTGGEQGCFLPTQAASPNGRPSTCQAWRRLLGRPGGFCGEGNGWMAVSWAMLSAQPPVHRSGAGGQCVCSRVTIKTRKMWFGPCIMCAGLSSHAAVMVKGILRKTPSPPFSFCITVGVNWSPSWTMAFSLVLENRSARWEEGSLPLTPVQCRLTWHKGVLTQGSGALCRGVWSRATESSNRQLWRGRAAIGRLSPWGLGEVGRHPDLLGSQGI